MYVQPPRQDKYMLGATNFVEHYAHDFHATDAQKDFVKAAMYGGAILGMIVMGSLAVGCWKGGKTMDERGDWCSPWR